MNLRSMARAATALLAAVAVAVVVNLAQAQTVWTVAGFTWSN
ncbi:hypothetical protein O7632_17765 [Solwaraspora sp. WMMD406]|nr:hypothetical protein [Solwaraspora sp. WMMD406]MDG4765932.1 hypothetical protein [Solwaraspora sp. WMMD406]